MKQTPHKPAPYCREAVLPTSGSPCTGCGLCVSVCTHGAVTLEENEDGFLAAKVDTTRCIGCRACEKMCARLAQVKGHDTHRFYEAWSKDEAQRRAASSGGVFGELAADCLRRGGVVFGVAMRGTDFPRFVAVERPEDLAQLRGSKYLQADPGHIFAEVAAALKAGRPVLFAGVSCQVRAARVRFGERYPNLLLIDLACFGTPSRHLFRSFLAQIGNSDTITNVAFRDKSRSWRAYSMALTHADGAQTLIHKEASPFMKGFLCHLSINESCYSCRSALHDRPGDITLGDCWGRPRREDERNGVSVVIAHTPAGDAALGRIREALHLEPIEANIALSLNEGLVAHSGEIPAARTPFLKALKQQPLKRVIATFLNDDGRPRPSFCFAGHFLPLPRRLQRLMNRLKSLASRCAKGRTHKAEKP